jgi:polar amino acid transport system substrate-binding protein
VSIRSSRLAAALLALCSIGAHAAPRELVMLAPLNHTMPIARFAGSELTGGILKDIGEALAAKLGRSARFIAVPSRRVGMVLSSGAADGVCLVQPHWIDGDFRWSAELIPTGGAVLARSDAPPITHLDGLRGKKVGTVSGYRYRVIEPLLGIQFLRDDAPSAQHNLRKLLAGRTQYVLMELSSAAYQVKNDPTRSLRLDITYENDMARCAFSPRSAIPYAEIKRATDSIIAERGVEKIMARYR